MKKLLSLLILLLVIQHVFSQEVEFSPTTVNSGIHEQVPEAKSSGAIEIYWSEDFSNGLDGQENNGQWTTDGAQGNLWFQTFPIDAENGYDPEDIIEEYGFTIPNFFEDRDVIFSPTRDNGVMMLDADRFNSSRTDPNDDFQLHILNSSIEAFLESPAIDLSINPLVELCFYTYSSVCCDQNRYAFVDVSIDGGSNWTLLDTVANLEDEYQTQVCLNMTNILADADDISNCKFRFRWNDIASHYFWFIDDVRIQSIPENEIVASTTWYKPHLSLSSEFENGNISAVEYYDSFEYHTIPDYNVKPIQPSIRVLNQGSALQTGVTLEFKCISPSGVEVGPFFSDPISVDPFSSSIISLEAINFGDQNDEIPVEIGEYILEYAVSQDAEDEIPANNIAESRRFYITDEGQGGAVYRNGDDRFGGAFNIGQDVIWSTAYSFGEDFPEGKAITHIETILQYADGFETQAGEVIYFNVRKGGVIEEDPSNPATNTTVLFDGEFPFDYNDESLEYEIQEEDIWNVQDDIPYNVFVSFELPNPVQINPGEIYQAEFRVPQIGVNAVFPIVVGSEEKYASFYYTYDEGQGQWTILSGLTVPIWFIIASSDDLSDNMESSLNSGVQLLPNYPNPFSEITRIQYRLNETANVSFEVFDMTGKLVYAEDHGKIPAGIAQSFNFEGSALSPGIYTYSIMANGKRVSRKLTIQ